jgi:hypothetical protein
MLCIPGQSQGTLGPEEWRERPQHQGFDAENRIQCQVLKSVCEEGESMKNKAKVVV